MSLQLSTFSAMVISDSIMSIINKIIFNPDNANLKFCEKVELLEKEFLLLDQVEIPVSHEFANGMYVRQITIPKGTLAISAYHKFGQFDIMLTGRMSIITDEGISEIVAPYCKMSNHGLKRFGYAYEDTIWLDVRPLQEMPVDEAEKFLFTDSYKELCAFEAEYGISNTIIPSLCAPVVAYI